MGGSNGKDTTREEGRRRSILRAAIEVFAKKGYHGCRIADVAKEAGVAYGLVYHYFKNKEELLQSVFENGWGGFVGQVRALCDGPGTVEDKVRAIIAVSFEAYRTDPRAVKVLLLEVARNPAAGKLDRSSAFIGVIRLVEDLFARAKAQGQLRPDADPLLAAAHLFGAIEMGLTTFVLGLYDARDGALLERAKGELANAYLRGVLPTGAGEPAHLSLLKAEDAPRRRRKRG